jgi:hypothetical protein
MAVEVGGVRVGAATRFWITMAVLPLGLTAAVYLLVGRVVAAPLLPRLAVTALGTALIAFIWTRFVRSASWWLVRVWLGIR